MSEEILRDSHGNKIGSIRNTSQGQEIRDSRGNRLGYYDERADVTKDNRGNRIGTGNQLSSLL
jgi:hypothetical protein